MTFRGTNVRITRVEIVGRTINFRIAFADDEGLIHGTMSHALSDAPDSMRAAAAALLETIQDFSQETHFGVQKETRHAARGIAETLHGSLDPADDSENQG